MDANERKQIVRDLNSAEQHLRGIWDINYKIQQGDQRLESYRQAAYKNSGYVGWPSPIELDKIRKETYQSHIDEFNRTEPAEKYNPGCTGGYFRMAISIFWGFMMLVSAVVLSVMAATGNDFFAKTPDDAETVAFLQKLNMEWGTFMLIVVWGVAAIFAIINIVGIRSIRSENKFRWNKYLRLKAMAEDNAKKQAEEAVNARLRDYNRASAEQGKKIHECKDYEKQWATERKALEESIRSRNAAAKPILDAYDIPDAFRSRDCIIELASMFDQQVVSTFQEAYGRLRAEQKANDRFRIDQMNRQFQWEMEQDARRERERKLEDERRWQRDIDRMHREKLETAARDLAYEERRKADALEDIKKKLED